MVVVPRQNSKQNSCYCNGIKQKYLFEKNHVNGTSVLQSQTRITSSKSNLVLNGKDQTNECHPWSSHAIAIPVFIVKSFLSFSQVRSSSSIDFIKRSRRSTSLKLNWCLIQPSYRVWGVDQWIRI